jgi:predicted GIY-YIG superfamily endonuclease
VSEPAEVVQLAERPQVLYRMFDSTRRLLYVGITANLAARFAEHAGEKPWWTSVVSVDLEHFTSRKAVERAEQEAVVSEAPLFNHAHTPRAGGGVSRRVTPARSTQIDDGPWAKFGADCEAINRSRAGVMKDLVLWWIRWPNATLPQRPLQ